MMGSPAFASLSSETIKRRLDYEIQISSEIAEDPIPTLDDLFFAALWIAKNEEDPEMDWKYFTESDVYLVGYKGRWFYAYSGAG